MKALKIGALRDLAVEEFRAASLIYGDASGGHYIVLKNRCGPCAMGISLEELERMAKDNGVEL